MSNKDGRLLNLNIDKDYNKHEIQMGIYTTKEIREYIKKKAKEEGMDISEYVINLVMNKEIKRVDRYTPEVVCKITELVNMVNEVMDAKCGNDDELIKKELKRRVDELWLLLK